MSQPDPAEQPGCEKLEHCPLDNNEDECDDGVCCDIFVVELGEVGAEVSEDDQEKHPDQRDVDCDLNGEASQERTDGWINWAGFRRFAHSFFSIARLG